MILSGNKLHFQYALSFFQTHLFFNLKQLHSSLSLYKNKLAVQLTDKICVYESNIEDLTDMHFKLRKERINIASHNLSPAMGGPNPAPTSALQDSIMVNVANHALFVRGAGLHLYSYEGVKVRSWQMDSKITTVYVAGGEYFYSHSFILNALMYSIFF